MRSKLKILGIVIAVTLAVAGVALALLVPVGTSSSVPGYEYKVSALRVN